MMLYLFPPLPRYFTASLLCLETVIMFILLVWMIYKLRQKRKDNSDTSMDTPDGNGNGVLQPYLNYRTGRYSSPPAGVRGTVRKVRIHDHNQEEHIQVVWLDRDILDC